MSNLSFTSFLVGLWWGLKGTTPRPPQPYSTGVPPPPKPLLVLPPPKPKE